MIQLRKEGFISKHIKRTDHIVSANIKNIEQKIQVKSLKLLQL